MPNLAFCGCQDFLYWSGYFVLSENCAEICVLLENLSQRNLCAQINPEINTDFCAHRDLVLLEIGTVLLFPTLCFLEIALSLANQIREFFHVYY